MDSALWSLATREQRLDNPIMIHPDEPLTLYWHPRTRSTRARWMLEELDVEHELRLVKLMEAEHKKPEHLERHPLGKVPVLQHGDRFIYESLAICLYLGDQFPEAGLAPALDDPRRGEYYQWMALSIGTFEPALFKLLLDKDDSADRRGSTVDTIIGVFERTLLGRMFLLGDRFSAADVMNGSIMGWAHSEGLVPEGSATDRWVRLLKDRPAYQRANESN